MTIVLALQDELDEPRVRRLVASFVSRAAARRVWGRSTMMLERDGRRWVIVAALAVLLLLLVIVFLAGN